MQFEDRQNSSLPVSIAEIHSMSLAMEKETPRAILAWAIEKFHPRIAFSTAFGPEGVVILDILMQLTPRIPVFTLDTGFFFKETLQLKEKLEQRYGISIESLKPELSVDEQAEKYGPELYRRNPNQCCAMRKVAPMRKKQKELDALVTGIRRSQGTQARLQAPIYQPVEDPESHHILVKVNPLATWSREEVWFNIKAKELPYNPLHDEGYASIGCWPCTAKVAQDEDERAGRWKGTDKKECGLHTFMDDVNQKGLKPGPREGSS